MNKRDNLLLTIVGENNNLQVRLKNATSIEKGIWGEAFKRLFNLGKEILEYANFLTDEELEDFTILYRTAAYVHDPLSASVKERARAAEQFMQLIIGEEDLLHRVILPAVNQEDNSFVEDIITTMDDLDFELNFLEINFMFVDKTIDRLLETKSYNTKEEKDQARLALEKEFTKLKKLTKFVKKYYEEVKAIITDTINQKPTEEQITEINDQLKLVNHMITYIESSFNTKRIERITQTNNDLEHILNDEIKMKH